MPWQEVAVDLIGPWAVNIGNKKIKFKALTVIDTVTNLTEVVRINNKSSAHISNLFHDTWLCRYPIPETCIHDPGGEFVGFEFQDLLVEHGITARSTTTKNPQANSICERMHQTIGNSLRVLTREARPRGVSDARQIVDHAIANASFALRSTYNSAIQTTPGGLAFGRDMILNLPLVTDLQLIQKRRQELIDKRLVAANARRVSHEYRINDEVMKLIYKPDKLDPRAEGPYRVVQVHQNGTLTIQLPNDTTERINIRRVKPYHR